MGGTERINAGFCQGYSLLMVELNTISLPQKLVFK